MVEWKIVEKPRFARQYKNMGHVRQSRVDLAIGERLTSDNPASMGRYKKIIRAFAYEVGRSDRRIYRVDLERREIVLTRVCDHKSAYGAG